MNSIGKKPPGARGIPQPFTRQAGSAPQFKPVVAQLKTAVSAQSINRPVAPPAYRPQAKPKVAQAKTASASRVKPIAPLVYHPQSVPKVLQLKTAHHQRATTPSKVEIKQPAAPAVYRPQAVPQVLQTKEGEYPRSLQKVASTPVAPPRYRPQAAPKVMQTKQANAHSRTVQAKNGGTLVEPPVYPPQPTPKVLQQKKASGSPARIGPQDRSAPALNRAGIPSAAQSKTRAVQPKTRFSREGSPRLQRTGAIQAKLKAKNLFGVYANAADAVKLTAETVAAAVKTAYDQDLRVNANRNVGTADKAWVTAGHWNELKAWWKDNPFNVSADAWNAAKADFTALEFTDADHRRDEHNPYELPTGELHFRLPSSAHYLNYHIRYAVTVQELARVTPPPPPPPILPVAPRVVIRDAWDD
jgi:hypothetical protein